MQRSRTMEPVTNFISVRSNDKLNISLNGDFFRVYVDFLQPIHELTKREMDVLAEFLKERYLLSKTIKDEYNLNKILLGKNTRYKIMETIKIKPKHLNVVLSTFRAKGILKKIGPLKDDEAFDLKLIPNFNKDGAGLMVYFNFKNEQQRIKLGPQEGKQKT